MPPSGADKLGGANALPIRLVMVATALALALIASLGWYVWNSVQVIRQSQTQTFRLLDLTREIAYLNEAIASSARLRASAREQRWLDRYLDMSKRRVEALRQFRALAPELADSSPLTDLGSASRRLLDIETRAFAL